MTKIENYEDLKNVLLNLCKDFDGNDDEYWLEKDIEKWLYDNTSCYEPRKEQFIDWDDETETGKVISTYDIEIDYRHSRSGNNEHIEIDEISEWENGVEVSCFYRY